MYKHFIKPILFSFAPETAHKLAFQALKLSQFLKLQPLLKSLFHPNNLHMKTELFGLTFPNKIGIAAGLDKNAEVFSALGSLGYGHVEIGTVTPKPQSGNPKPRSFRLVEDKGLINRMGFNNHGLNAIVKRLKYRNTKLIIGGNIGKNTLTPNDFALKDYITCFNGIYAYVDYIVVNVSCPNVTDLHKLQDQDSLEEILRSLNELRANKPVYKPILLKISPDLNFQQIDETLRVIKKNKIDGVIAVNTTTLRENLKTPAEKLASIGNGGLSGQPIKDRSTEVIKYIYNSTEGKLPIIGVGGIFTPEDALEKLNAGASLVQVYSGFIFEGLGLAKKLNRKIKEVYISE